MPVIVACSISLLRAPGIERPFRTGFCAKSAFPSAVVIRNLSNPKPGHTTGGLIRGGARREGGSGRRRAAQDADGTIHPGDNRPSYPSDDARITFWACLWKHEQRKSYLNRWGPMEEQNPRLTRGSSAVYPRFINGTRSALRSLLLTGVPTPICLCKPFSCKACPGLTPRRPRDALGTPGV